jgi:hypothetical protein
MRRSTLMAAGLALALAGAGRLEAQPAWETPMLIGPMGPAGFGVHLMEPWPGSGIGVLGTYRTSPVPVGLGFRLGIGEAPGDRIGVFGGLDVSGRLFRSADEVPIEVLWFTGAGLGASRNLLLSFPLGLSVGALIDADGVRFGPYLAPRVVLDVCSGDDRRPRAPCGPGDNLDMSLAVDLGLDLAFDPNWMIRFAATLGDRDSLLIGIAFPR